MQVNNISLSLHQTRFSYTDSINIKHVIWIMMPTKVTATQLMSVWVEKLNLYLVLPFSDCFEFLWLPLVYLGV